MDYYILRNGYELQKFSFGMSFIKDRQSYKGYCQIVDAALDGGFRWFDCARDYGNEPYVGKAIRDICIKKGLKRNDVYLTTKVGNSQQVQKDMERELFVSLKNLQTDYIDLWMLHWPYPDYFIDNWKQMIGIYKQGLVKAIGICNMNSLYLNKLISSDVEILPLVIQNEIHPFNTDYEFQTDCSKYDILFEAHTACGSMIDKITQNKLLIELSRKYRKTISQIILRWHNQQGRVPVTRSKNTSRCISMLDLFDFELSQEEMAKIAYLNEDYCLIPKSVFCIGY